MEENQFENQQVMFDTNEPEMNPDNSIESNSTNPEVTDVLDGQSQLHSLDPSNMILGKFKSQEDLANAYQQLEKLQGAQSAELGHLRQNAYWINNIQKAWENRDALMNCAKEIQETAQKYNTPEYFQDPSFQQMYKEAFLALGKNLDSEKFINLLEGYVSSRLMRYKQEQNAKNETERVLDGMKFSGNKNFSIKPAGKRLDQMTPEEIDDLLDRLL